MRQVELDTVRTTLDPGEPSPAFASAHCTLRRGSLCLISEAEAIMGRDHYPKLRKLLHGRGKNGILPCSLQPSLEALSILPGSGAYLSPPSAQVLSLCVSVSPSLAPFVPWLPLPHPCPLSACALALLFRGVRGGGWKVSCVHSCGAQAAGPLTSSASPQSPSFIPEASLLG